MKHQQYLVPEDQLLRRLNKRDEQAFQWLYDQYAHVIYGVVLTSVRLPDVAKQVVEEVFVKAWQDFDQFNPRKTRLLTWMLLRARQEALRAIPQPLPNLPPQLDSSLVDNLISPDHRILLDAIYFRGQAGNEPTTDNSGITSSLRNQLRVILQELKLVFTQ